MSTIGFIGLGNMGFPMAGRLAAAGHELIVHDASTEAVEKFLTTHPTAAAATTWSCSRTASTIAEVGSFVMITSA
jgi:3-hydroxyisobutyrate dehydrogenase-like beta-hydroxyacid dehydrogenase